MRDTDPLTIGEVARRAGLATSAVRYYEQQGLITASRAPGGSRRYPRAVLRRLAFVRAAQNVGLSLQEIRDALATLPAARTPTKADWARLSRSWQPRPDAQIAALIALRNGLTSCIGCGCLSLARVRLVEPRGRRRCRRDRGRLPPACPSGAASQPSRVTSTWQPSLLSLRRHRVKVILVFRYTSAAGGG